MNGIWGRWAVHHGIPDGAPAVQHRTRNEGWNILHQSQRLDSLNLDAFDVPPMPSTSATPFPAVSPHECVICRDGTAQLASSPPTDRCQHPAEACAACLQQTVKIAIVSESNSNIRCPGSNCSEVMEYEDVKLWADETTFERYNELLLQRLLQKEENYVTCLNPTCGAGQVHGGENIFPIVTCYKCGAKTCYRHREDWHEGYTCKEWDRREERWKQEDILSREWVANQTKRCPGAGCNRPIRKEYGCDHMTCRRPGGCGHEFCWFCLAPYGPIRIEGNQKHNPSCIYRSDYVAPPIPVAVPPVQQPNNRRRWGFWRRQDATVS